MSTPPSPTKPLLTEEDILGFRQLIKLTDIMELNLDEQELRTLIPQSHLDKREYQSFEKGTIRLHPGKVCIKNPNKENYVGSFDIMDIYSTPKGVQSYDNYAMKHFSHMFGIFVQKFGFEWLVYKFIAAIDKKFVALSTGQADAIVKKYLIRARDDGKTLNSTDRSQLHKLRQKIEKYKPLVDTFSGVMLQGVSMMSIISEFYEGVSLERAPKSTKHGTTAEIMELREKIKEKGLDPDWDPPAVNVSEAANRIQSLEGFYFICDWCDHTESYELDENGRIMPKSHHGKPMFLKMPRKDSDY